VLPMLAILKETRWVTILETVEVLQTENIELVLKSTLLIDFTKLLTKF